MALEAGALVEILAGVSGSLVGGWGPVEQRRQ
jgi:uncharacterized membrane protein YeaQ/YmgE (transglycosylase-associated protein family)